MDKEIVLVRQCSKCGKVVEEKREGVFCPYCGNALVKYFIVKNVRRKK